MYTINTNTGKKAWISYCFFNIYTSLFTIFEFTTTFFVINLSKDGGSAFNEVHDFAFIVHPVYHGGV